MKKNRCFSNILKLLGLVCITCSLFLIIYNFIMDYRAGKMSQTVLDELTPIIEKNASSENNNTVLDLDTDMPFMEIDKNAYIGIISMETVDIKLPVLKNYSQNNLKIAPALYQGSIYNNHAIIIAHNTLSHFRNIKKLNIGDPVIFEDIHGNVFEYTVILKEIISGEDIDLMEQGDWDLTLFTCTDNSIARSTIRLRKVVKEYTKKQLPID